MITYDKYLERTVNPATVVGTRVRYIGHLSPDLAGFEGTTMSCKYPHPEGTCRVKFDRRNDIVGVYPKSLKAI